MRDPWQRLTAAYREYPRPFWTLVVVTFIDRLGGALLYPFFALYITSKFDVGMTVVGQLFAIFAFSSFLGGTLGGALADRLGRKSIVIFSLVMTSISSVLMGLVETLNAFFLVAIVTGILTETGGPAYQAVVADLLRPEKRAEGFGILRVAFNVSVTIGPAIGGFLAARSYLLLFLADAAISLITAIVFALTMPETKPETDPSRPAESLATTFRGYFQVFGDSVFMLFLAGTMVIGLVYMNMNTTLGVYLRDVHQIPESGYGLILSLNAAMVVLFQFPITRRIEGLPPMLVMGVGALLYALGFGLYGFVTSYALFLVAMAIVTVGEMVIAPVAQAITATLAPEDKRGRYMAVFGFSFAVPFAIGPYLAGLILDHLNPDLLWYVAALLGTISALWFVALHRSRQQATATVAREPQPR